jgi:hypothetical protein
MQKNYEIFEEIVKSLNEWEKKVQKFESMNPFMSQKDPEVSFIENMDVRR